MFSISSLNRCSNTFHDCDCLCARTFPVHSNYLAHHIMAASRSGSRLPRKQWGMGVDQVAEDAKLTLREFELPAELQDDEVEISVFACGFCSTDMHTGT